MACGSMRTTRLPKSMAMMTQSEDGYRCTHTSCPVCLEELDVFAKSKTERATVLRPCKHTFHRRCIKSWFIAEMRRGKQSLSCPLCRTEIVPRTSVVTKYSGRVYKGFTAAACRMFRRGKHADGTMSVPVSPSRFVERLL